MRYLAPGRISEREYNDLHSAEDKFELSADTKPIMFDRLAYFERYGICFGNHGEYNYDMLPSIIESGIQRYYVYKLITPTGGVFYVGKGSGRRILEHEKELESNSFRVHTNWKKLNKIAQILMSGKRVRYVIDSWHKPA